MRLMIFHTCRMSSTSYCILNMSVECLLLGSDWDDDILKMRINGRYPERCHVVVTEIIIKEDKRNNIPSIN